MPDQRNIALDLMKREKFDEALKILENFAESHPDDADTFHLIGQCHRFNGNFPEAIQAHKRAVELDRNAHHFYCLGIAYQLGEDYKAAIAALEQAIKLDPKLCGAYNSIGLTHKKSGDSKEALKWYYLASKCTVDAASEKAHGDHEEKDKCFRDEIKDGEKVRTVFPYLFEKIHEILRSNPEYAIIMNNIGVCHMAEAISCFKESIEFIPDGFHYPNPYENLKILLPDDDDDDRQKPH